jgi:hypothetical protein
MCKEHPLADILRAIADGKQIQFRSKASVSKAWFPYVYLSNGEVKLWSDNEYRIKPKTFRFRNYLVNGGWVGAYTERNDQYTSALSAEELEKRSYFVKWIGDWQEIEIE